MQRKTIKTAPVPDRIAVTFNLFIVKLSEFMVCIKYNDKRRDNRTKILIVKPSP